MNSIDLEEVDSQTLSELMEYISEEEIVWASQNQPIQPQPQLIQAPPQLPPKSK